MSRRQRLALTALLALVALGASIAVGSSIISSPSTGPGRKRPATAGSPAPTTTAPSPVPKGLVTFRDPEDGFSIVYPKTWTRVQAPDPSDKEVRLLVADGTKVSLLIRVAPVDLTVTKQTLGIARGFTDSLVAADRRVKLLSKPEAITLDGLPGYRYAYTFAAGPGGRRGAHVHYFLFSRKRLISLVFQVPGAGALKRDSELLDGVAGTFRAVH